MLCTHDWIIGRVTPNTIEHTWCYTPVLKLSACISNAAVQEERQRKDKPTGDSQVESTSGASNDMPVEKILEAELAVEPNHGPYVDTPVRGSYYGFWKFLTSPKDRDDVVHTMWLWPDPMTISGSELKTASTFFWKWRYKETCAAIIQIYCWWTCEALIVFDATWPVYLANVFLFPKKLHSVCLLLPWNNRPVC